MRIMLDCRKSLFRLFLLFCTLNGFIIADNSSVIAIEKSVIHQRQGRTARTVLRKIRNLKSKSTLDLEDFNRNRVYARRKEPGCSTSVDMLKKGPSNIPEII